MGSAAYHGAPRCGRSIANTNDARAEFTSPDYSPVATIYRWSRCHPKKRHAPRAHQRAMNPNVFLRFDSVSSRGTRDLPDIGDLNVRSGRPTSLSVARDVREMLRA